MRNPKNQSNFQAQPEIPQVKQSTRKVTCVTCNPPKQKLPPGMRRIKIQQKFVAQRRSYTPVPAIILTGKWLEKLGFEDQNHVIITEKKRQLIINLDTA